MGQNGWRCDNWMLQMDEKWKTIEEWMDAYATRITRVVTGMLGDEEQARDLVQELFVKIYFNLDKFEAKSTPYTYLYRIAVNMALDCKRARAREAERTFSGSSTAETDMLERVPDSNHSSKPEESLMEKDTIQRIRNTVDTLKEPFRETAILFYLGELSLEEISMVTGDPTGTVKSRLYRARKQLQKALIASELSAQEVGYGR